MTKGDAIKLVAIAVAAFPTMLERDMAPTASAWFEMLGDLEYPLALNAVKKVLSTAKFFPTVADIRDAAASMTPSSVPTAEDAWAEFLKAKKEHGFNDAPASLKSPEDPEHGSGTISFRQPWDFSNPVIGRVVRAMWGSWINCYAEMMDKTIGVDRAQFLNVYQTLTKRERERALLPPAVQEFAELAVGAFKALPDVRRRTSEAEVTNRE